MTDHPDNTLSIQEAAAHYNVSEKTIRRRIKNGSLSAFQNKTAQGFEWRVQIPSHPVQIDNRSRQVSPTLDNEVNKTTRQDHNNPALIKALELVEHLQHDNIQLAGQLGFYQAKLQEAEQQIRLLTTTKEEQEPVTKSWWKRLLQRK